MRLINERLRQVLESIKCNTYKKEIDIDIVKSLPFKFIEVNGCVLLCEDNEVPNLDMDYILRQFGDRSGFEAADSHVHMIDISKRFVEDPYQGLHFAIYLTSLWSCKLKSNFPYFEFIIYVTFHGNDTIIRFHKLREDEPTWIDIERVDEYKEEGIMIQMV
ncbi:hypothetical protein SAMN04488688_10866 [Paenibacillus sp. cl141a]|uniref:hypothetical protein n=1 Tax=Paenibacillus sp. cl141a TaxID=1761877 RepID=UPI0008D7045C|nr:hypothetical protein [Paenibacillus sp. cl141a]SEM04277.1 hypothetical protein SAMN04488688_10866 [Paenibacillus sp. cl141a]